LIAAACRALAMKKSVSIIITNWNGRELLEECLPSIVEAVKFDNDRKYIVQVVDDCSNDDSIPYLEKNYPDIKLIKTPVNMGFQGAVNYGAKNSESELIAILNNDIKIHKNTFKILSAYFDEEDIFAVTGAVFGWDKKTFLYGNRGGYFKGGHFYLFEKERYDLSQTLFACGGAFICNRIKFLELNGFDTIFHPLYYEEIDLSYRAMKRGWSILYEPKAVFYHKVQSTITKQESKKRIGYISGRNNYLFVWKNITDPGKIISYMIFIPFFLVRDLLKGKIRFWISFFLAIKKIPELLRKRKIEKQYFKLTDEEILFAVNSGYKLRRK